MHLSKKGAFFFEIMIKDFIKFFENIVPKGAAWDNDNVGLQFGNPNEPIKNILVCLELNLQALKFAINNNCNFIITHHPFIFTPVKNINYNTNNGKIIIDALKNNITVYSAHTNLDFSKDGVSYQLAKKLKLTKLKFLSNADNTRFKVSVFVPTEYVEKVSEAIFEAGGGIIGDYEKCSYRVNGKGTFEGNENTNPTIGTKQNFEIVDEIKLEIILNKWDLHKVINALLKSHPYEEPAYDIYPLLNKNENFGAGVIGYLNNSMDINQFLAFVKTELNLDAFKYTIGSNNTIHKVAVCGGSGSDLLNTAIEQNADAFITADIKYHTFHDASGKITLIDAGHYETEIFGLNTIKNIINKYIKINNRHFEIFEFLETNPIRFYYNLGDK